MQQCGGQAGHGRRVQQALPQQEQQQRGLDALSQQGQGQRGLDTLTQQEQQQRGLDALPQREQQQRGLDALTQREQQQRGPDALPRQGQGQRGLDAWGTHREVQPCVLSSAARQGVAASAAAAAATPAHLDTQQCQRGPDAWEPHPEGRPHVLPAAWRGVTASAAAAATPAQPDAWEQHREGQPHVLPVAWQGVTASAAAAATPAQPDAWEQHREVQPHVLFVLPLQGNLHRHQHQQGMQQQHPHHHRQGQHGLQQQQQQQQQQQRCLAPHTTHNPQGATAAAKAAAGAAAEGTRTGAAAQPDALHHQAPQEPSGPSACRSYAFGRHKRRQAAQAAAWQGVAAAAAAAPAPAAPAAGAAEGKVGGDGSGNKKRGKAAHPSCADGGSAAAVATSETARAVADLPFMPAWLLKPTRPPKCVQRASGSESAGRGARLAGVCVDRAGQQRQPQRWRAGCSQEHRQGHGQRKNGGLQQQQQQQQKGEFMRLDEHVVLDQQHHQQGHEQPQQQQRQQQQQGESVRQAEHVELNPKQHQHGCEQPQGESMQQDEHGVLNQQLQQRKCEQPQQQQQLQQAESMLQTKHGVLNQHQQGCEQETSHAMLQQHQEQTQQGSGLGLLQSPPHASPQLPDSQPVSARIRRRQRRRAALASALRNAPPDPPHTLLLRLVDDYLMLSSSRAAAEALLTRLERGFPEYGCSINAAKTQVNFSSGESRVHEARPSSVDAPPEQQGRPSCGSREAPIRWCGLLINPTSLEIQADYSRYAGTHIATVLTVPLTNHPGRQLPVRLMLYMRPKCHPLLLDATINSPLTARLNIFQAFMMSAMKLHSYVRVLVHVSAGPGVRGLSPACHPRHLLNAIFSACAYMAGIVRSRTYAFAMRFGLGGLRCDVPGSQVRWLGLAAFERVLGKKQSVYGPVLLELRQHLVRLSASRGCAPQMPLLLDTINSQRSKVFDDIFY